MFRANSFHTPRLLAAFAAVLLASVAMIPRAFCQDSPAPPPPAATAAPATDAATSTIVPAPSEPLQATTPGAPVPMAAPTPKPAPRTSIEIDLQEQKAYLLRDGHKLAESPVSSGRAGHLTPRGEFSVIEKDPNHTSNLYGQIVDKSTGRVVIA